MPMANSNFLKKIVTETLFTIISILFIFEYLSSVNTWLSTILAENFLLGKIMEVSQFICMIIPYFEIKYIHYYGIKKDRDYNYLELSFDLTIIILNSISEITPLVSYITNMIVYIIMTFVLLVVIKLISRNEDVKDKWKSIFHLFYLMQFILIVFLGLIIVFFMFLFL